MERQPADALKYSLLLRQANKEQYENEGNEGMRSGDPFHLWRKGSVIFLMAAFANILCCANIPSQISLAV